MSPGSRPPPGTWPTSRRMTPRPASRAPAALSPPPSSERAPTPRSYRGARAACGQRAAAPRVATALSPALEQFYPREEVPDLQTRALRAVRAVDAIRFDGGGEIPADGARPGLGRIGGAHDLPQLRDRVLPLQDQDHAGAGGH